MAWFFLSQWLGHFFFTAKILFLKREERSGTRGLLVSIMEVDYCGLAMENKAFLRSTEKDTQQLASTLDPTSTK